MTDQEILSMSDEEWAAEAERIIRNLSRENQLKFAAWLDSALAEYNQRTTGRK